MKNAPEKFTHFNLYVQDESRFGLFTRNGRALTAKGVKPICTYQNIFKSTYIFGAFSPINGDSLVMELPYCNGDNFQIFLNELSNKNTAEFKVIPIRNINWSYCQFERSREPLDHLDCARCDKKGLDFYICLIGIIILDNGAFHKGKSLIIPENIALIFLPPYSPELNPAELVWLNMKRKTTNKIYKTMEKLKLKLDEIVKELITENFIKNLCSFDYFFA